MILFGIERVNSMDWLEILQIHKGLDLFFNVSIPAALEKQEPFGHVLLICPDSEVRRRFSELLLNAIQPLAVDYSSEKDSMITKPVICLRNLRWDVNTACGDVGAILTTMTPRDMLLLNKDTIELPGECIDMLCMAMDSYSMDIKIGKGSSARSIRLDLPEFTFVVCTAVENEELRTMASHFSYVIRISKGELKEICEKAILMKAQEEGCSFSDEACEYIVRCSAYDCMAAINYASRVIEYMRHYHAIGTLITEEHVMGVLSSLGIDNTPVEQRPNDDVVTMLRDIQKKLSYLGAEVAAIKETLSAIQGEEHEHNLTDIANALDRIEESMY